MQRGYDITIRDSKKRFVQKLQHIRLPSSCALYIPNINMRMYIHGPGPGPVLCMIRERHVILKAALHSWLYSCLAVASYIIIPYCRVYSF